MNFADAANKGLQSAKNVDAAKDEIREVIADLCRQIDKYTDGRVGAERCPTRLVFVNIRSSSTICDFDEGPCGYPVRIQSSVGITTATDRASLESAICDVLASPESGRTLMTMMEVPK